MDKKLIIALFCLTVIFMTGMLAIDVGATAQAIEACSREIRLVAASLILGNLEPRIVYHAGVLTVILCWITLIAVMVMIA
jgi:hypothetical protein